MPRGAPKGNTNGAKGKMWEGAVRRTLAQQREALNDIAKAVVAAAQKGEAWAVTEIRNTLDGKPKEHLQIDETLTVTVGDSAAIAPALTRALGLRSKPTVQ